MYGVRFENRTLQRAMRALFDISCPVCDLGMGHGGSFQQLRDHVRREHSLYYCETCEKHLKLFPSERKIYGTPEPTRMRALCGEKH